MSLQDDIIKGLKSRFQFKRVGGEWLQGGKCPQCGKNELFCSAKEPKIVRCGRAERCGWEDSVRSQLPELFENWSERFKQSEADPNAAADAYLRDERGLQLHLVRGSFTQEWYRDPETGQTGATVRFAVGNTFWERIIDRPGRFGKKAHFKAGGSWKGHCWIPPVTSMDALAAADEIWIAEGIFDAVALTQCGKMAVSAMSVNVWPEQFLADLRTAIEGIGRADRPRLVWAFDVGSAGVTWTRKFVKKSRDQGWDATAAQVRPDGEGTKLDWNDLLLRQIDWRGDKAKGPMGPDAFDEYLWNGAVTIAETARQKAKLIVERRAWSAFDFRHGNKLWWCRVRHEKDDDGEPKRTLEVEEIANCAFRLLYRERDEILNETDYFLQIDFPDQPTVKAKFSASACSNSGEFKKRLMAFAGIWAGTGDQLDRIMRSQIRQLRVVEPIGYTGYVPAHNAYLFGDIAVHQGRLLTVNRENYFDLGGASIKLKSAERLLDIHYDPDQLDFEWLPHLWRAYGPKGLIVLGFFTASLFATQIRLRQKSFGFLEVTGEPGSGKTTLIEFMWKLFGRVGYEGFDPNKATNAAFARNLLKVSNLPVGLIEGRRGDEDNSRSRQFDFNELLVLYNGRSPRSLGTRTGGFETVEPPFHGTIYLMQNERIDAIPAVLERLMSMVIDKSRWTEDTRESAVLLEGWPMEAVSGTLIHVARKEADYLKFYFDRAAQHERGMPARVDGLFNSRPIKTHSQLAAAVEALPHLFPTCRPEWLAETIDVIDAMALDRQQSAGGDHPLVASFWDKIDYIVSREADDAHATGRSINQHRDPERLIAISLPDFEARCRHLGIAPPDLDRLKKVLRGSKSRKWIDTKSVNAMSGKTIKCWVFAQPRRADDII